MSLEKVLKDRGNAKNSNLHAVRYFQDGEDTLSLGAYFAIGLGVVFIVGAGIYAIKKIYGKMEKFELMGNFHNEFYKRSRLF